jgi:hypothetical protein
MRLNLRTLALALACAGGLFAQGVAVNGRVLVPGCGALGQRPCNPGDLEYAGNNVHGNNMACDYGLLVDPGNLKCDDFLHLRQHFAHPIGGWTGWALAEQQYSIGADQAINWISIFGSHNSFSNPTEGGSAPINVDQVLTIADQLQNGARYVRLDPQDYNGQLRLCHSFSSFLCADLSYGRLWAYGLQEIADWLHQHPGEFVVMRLHGAPGGFDYDTTINDILGPMIFKPNFWDSKVNPPQPYPFRFPSLRELRASGKQIVILGDIGGGGSNAVFCWNQYVMDDGYSDARGFGACQNQKDQDIRVRASSLWSYIGEDRSGSNAFNAVSGPPGAGLLDDGAVQHASRCGFGMINVDFLDSLPQAYKDGPLPLVPFFPVDFTGPTPDTRRDSFIWSWFPGDFGAAGPAALSLADFHWHGFAESTNLPYVCAGPGHAGEPFPDPMNPAGMDWQIATNNPGPWANGEAQCQAQFGSAYHFWAPASGFENGSALELMRFAQVSLAWLNHRAGPSGVSIFPSVLSYTYTIGDALPAVQNLRISGGAGGPLTGTFAPQGGTNFLNVTQTAPNQFQAALANNVTTLGPGVYKGIVNVTELAPLSNTYNTQAVHVSLTVLDTLTVSPNVVDLSNFPQDSHNVTISAGLPIGFTLKASDPWIAVQTNGNTTPATVTISGNSLGMQKGFYKGTVTVNAPNASNSPQIIQVNYKVDAVTTIVTRPPGLTFTADGHAFNTPQTFPWAVGGNHNVSAAQTQGYGGAGTRVNFTDWSDGGALSHTVAGSDTVRQITLDYGKQYLVTGIASPSGDGTIAFSPSSTDGYYDADTPITATATPNTGFVFTGFTGDLSSHNNPANFIASSPKSITATFDVNTAHFTTLIDTVPTGLSVVVDGTSYTAPVNVSWQAGTPHTIGIATSPFVQGGVQYTFTGWSDGGLLSHSVTAPSQNGTSLVASFSLAYQLTVAANPASGGSVTGAAFWPAGSNVQVQATPALNFSFTEFSGDLSGTSNPAIIAMNAPHSVTANFVGRSAVLYAAQGTRTDGPVPGTRLVTLQLVSVGQGVAANAEITSITGITVVQGSGTVTLDQSAVLPAVAGTLSPGQSGSATLLFDWPATATQVRFAVHFSANNGATTGATTLTIFR